MPEDGSIMMKLENIYKTFNLHRPEDFKGHSLSVSDVVVLHQEGKDTAFYVDSIGFEEVPAFFSNRNRTGSVITLQRIPYSVAPIRMWMKQP